MQIRPQETFPVLYQISDPSDATTYYVRAVIRNSATGAVIRIANQNFVNLVRSATNSRRFSVNIQAPADQNGGQGMWIDVTVTVYTDSGYTTASTVYEENIDKYLVQERWNLSWAGGGGNSYGGKEDLIKAIKETIDYERIGGKVKEHTDSINIPEYEDRTDEVLASTRDLHRSIKNIKPADKVDLTPHTTKIIKTIKEVFAGIKIPEYDFDGMLARIEAIKRPDQPDLATHFDALKSVIKQEIGTLKSMIPSKEYVSFMDDLSKRLVTKPDISKRITGRTEKEDPHINRARNLMS